MYFFSLDLLDMTNYVNPSEFTCSTAQETQIHLCKPFKFWNRVKTMSQKRLWSAWTQNTVLLGHSASCCFVCPQHTLWVLSRIWGMRECAYISLCLFWAVIEECWMFPAGNNFIFAHGLRNRCRSIDSGRKKCSLSCSPAPHEIRLYGALRTRCYHNTHFTHRAALAFHAVTLKIIYLNASWANHPSNFFVELDVQHFINFCSFRPSHPVLSSIVSYLKGS